ncbi:MAG: M20/M25/M40 family metallo-hydrolase, partial [Myxococcales bacterium]|nr:M20/M25/M40 family metallo-hydrolase [Polyangiaceae bacterium]MDW8252146.1 M20/M25/M40 family metallo-hydrolase [Myxococcales bacterium]
LLCLDGLSTELCPSHQGHGPHLLARTNASGPPVALVGHLDTVFPPGTFEGYRVEGALRRGPGVLDMKGGLVVVTLALRALAHEGLLASLPLRLIIVSDEEIGSPEGSVVIRTFAAASQAALVFEAGRPQDLLITRRKGTGTLRAIARGKSAHAGNLHHEGVNAAWALAIFVDRAQQLTSYEDGRTVNVGKFTAGEVANTVPDYAEALVDLRFTSPEQGRWLLEALDRAAREAEQRVAGSQITLYGGLSRMPMERSEGSVRLLRAYAAAAAAEGLGTGEAPLLGGGSDACTTSAMGIASLDGLGPRGKGFHTLDEQIEVETLLPKAAALTRFLAAWPGEPTMEEGSR